MVEQRLDLSGRAEASLSGVPFLLTLSGPHGAHHRDFSAAHFHSFSHDIFHLHYCRSTLGKITKRQFTEIVVFDR